MKKLSPWSDIYPQFVALKLSSAFSDPSVIGRVPNFGDKVLGVKYKDGRFQFVLLLRIELYDGVQFVAPFAQSGIVHGEYESLKNIKPELSGDSAKRIFFGVVIGFAILVGISVLFALLGPSTF